MQLLPPIFFVIFLFCSAYVHSESDKKNVVETIPTTMANLRGHQELYKNGWFIITSSEKAIEYAKEHSVVASSDAITELNASLETRSKNYKDQLKSDLKKSKETTEDIYKSGSERTQNIHSATQSAAAQQWLFSKEAAVGAWDTFINGYIYLGARTKESRQGLSSVPQNFYTGITEDFSDLSSGVREFHGSGAQNIKENWVEAFDQAEAEFTQAYEDSGKESNSMTGLWTLLGGYLSGVWEGLIKPSGETAWQTTTYTAKVAGEAIFLPVASSYIVVKNTLLSTGSALYYTGKTGIEVVSPTLEGGFLASMSLVSAGAVPLTYVGGTSAGVINQVASTAAAPVAGVGQGVVSTTVDTVSYGALVTYDAVAATTKVFINQVKSGVVLGYNALTAIPSHLMLGAVNTAYFLVIDGPKLAIASVQGDVVINSTEGAETMTFKSGQLPTGTVIDINALRSNTNADIQIVTDDPEVIEKVIESMPKDLHR